MARLKLFLFYLFVLDRSLGFVVPHLHNQRHTDRRLSSSEVSKQSDFTVDPLLFNVLHEASTVDLGGVRQATQGIAIWRSALLKGRLPVVESEVAWPVEPLFSKLVDAMVEMQLPRFVLRHPDTVTVVLLSLLRLTIEFSDMMKEAARDQEQLEEDEGDENGFYYDDEEYDSFREEVPMLDLEAISREDAAQRVADEIARGFSDQWGGVVGGVRLLDQLFGADHGLLDISEAGGAGGFGLEDGIWQHTGWKAIPELQNEISEMPELRDLMNQLGRRPTALKSDAIHKFAPRKLKQDGALGAQFDPQMRDSVSGLTLSGSLTEMLPSEAMLLRGSPALRRLFLAKKVESKLLSYQQSGWEDVPSIPIPRTSFLRRMPSAPGGPIVVCLDTSWSMSGIREQLSKAVVLSCVTAAHKQRRDCQVVAFSTERGTVESGIITPDASGLQRLLDFLSGSFGGGTDVTGALKYAMLNLGTEVMAAADILMVTDGEIPDPPVSNEIMEALDSLKLHTEMEIHGLLVGKSESVPLSRLCTQTHDFLVDYDMPAGLRSQSPVSATTLSYSERDSWSRAKNDHPKVRGKPWGSGTGALSLRGSMAIDNAATSSRLSARKDRFNEDFDEAPRGSGKRKKNKRQSESEQEEDNEGVKQINENMGDYQSLVAQATNELTSVVTQSLQRRRWDAKELDEERENEVSCWKYFGELEKAIEKVGEGLIEREEEARLVVLAMVTREHILLLGVPGTGKSVLGRRLSSLCGGSFFQRLLTRFTTPEEIFGPLSLKSLENDEYRRCTEGFLPTASIAFLDEIFKANSAILNTLLTILNERKFDNGAGRQEQCPIQCVVGASNELPESDELDALYDRFLLRKYVSPVSDEGLLKLLALSNPGVASYGVDDTLADAADDIVFSNGFEAVVNQLNVGSTAVHMGEAVCLLMKDLRAYMRDEHQVEVSDRRLVQATKLLRVSAITHGRMQVDLIDCMLMQHLVWKIPEQRSAVREWLWDNITPGGTEMAQFRLLLDGLREEAFAAVRNTGGDVTGAAGGRKADLAVLEALRMEINRIVAALSAQKVSLERHMELLNRSSSHLWLDPSEAHAMQQLLLPRAQAITAELDEVAVLAASLEMTLLDGPSSPSNEVRLSVMESLWDADFSTKVSFTDEELEMGMKEAKAKFDLETFRKWKRTKKKLQAATA